MNTLSKIFGTALATAALSGCGGDAPVAGTTLTLGLTDAPVDEAEAVVVSFSAVELLDTDGGVAERIEFVPAASVDLLDQQGGAQFLLLEEREVAPGVYPEIRLVIENQANASCKQAQSNPDHPAYITVDGVDHPLIIPGGGSAGLRLRGPLTVDVGQQARYTIDFDLRKSIAQRGTTGCYNLKPVLRLVESAEAGLLSGSVDAALLADSACSSDPVTGQGAAVYLFAGANVAPDDFDGAGAEPVTTALLQPVIQDGATVSFTYAAGFLEAGAYTVALSCRAGEDLPDSDDALDFVQPGNAEVRSGQTTVFDFQVTGTD